MDKVSRRNFVTQSLAIGAGLAASVPLLPQVSSARPRLNKDDISIAQWALVEEVRQGKWKTVDFPKIARKDFDINGIEFVNTLFEVPTDDYLRRLKKNAADFNVSMVLIMVDGEGETCTPDKAERKQTEINHRKWVDIAQYLGCHAIRTNCRGPENLTDKAEALNWAVDSYHMMLEYAVPAKISILIENHGGVSNDAEWMVQLMKAIDNPYFGSYPDWRGSGQGGGGAQAAQSAAPMAGQGGGQRQVAPRQARGEAFDHVAYLEKMLPWAGGMSYRNQQTEEATAKLIKMCRDAGYRGWYGIESGPREGIVRGKQWLQKYLLAQT